MTSQVAVLGAGLQGACVAMELAAAGVSVDLYDRNDRCLAQASARNEGKIHLGYVYARDRTRATARTMVRGAVAFAPLLRRWIGTELEAVPVSKPFHYAVHAASMVGAEEVEAHLRASRALALEQSRGRPPDYFGLDYRTPVVRLPERDRERLFDPRAVTAAFRTPEIAIDPEALAERVRRRLEGDPKIRTAMGTEVLSVRAEASGLTVESRRDGDRARDRYHHVVNALWDGRLAVDRSAGLEPERPWIYRFKHYLRLRVPRLASSVPNTTIVLGPFGDVVTYGGRDLYLSWYPAAMTATSTDLAPSSLPPTLDGPAAAAMRSAIMGGLRPVVPGLAGLTTDELASSHVGGGVIFARGDRDIHDPASRLHQRHSIGITSHGRYHTVNTGKLTMAPLFGKAVADRILQRV